MSASALRPPKAAVPLPAILRHAALAGDRFCDIDLPVAGIVRQHQKQQ
jgi:hypothetical protein